MGKCKEMAEIKCGKFLGIQPTYTWRDCRKSRRISVMDRGSSKQVLFV